MANAFNRMFGVALSRVLNVGDPAPGSTILVVLSGTNTPATLFADSAGTIPLVNPFTADVNGYWFFYTTLVRVDVQITPPGEAPYTLSDYQAITGSAAVFPYVLQGADPTGATDSSPALQAAVNLGGLLIIPPGLYSLHSVVTISTPIRIIGGGPGLQGGTTGNTVLQAATLGQDVLHINAHGATLESLQISRSGSSNAHTDGVAVVVGTVAASPGQGFLYNIFRDILCIGHSLAFHFQNAASWQLDNCYCYTGSCVLVENQANVDAGDASIMGCTLFASDTVTAGTYGIKVLSGGGLKVANCKLLGGQYGVLISWFAGNSIAPLITNCSFENWTVAGISVTAGTLLVDLIINGNFIDILANPSGPAILVNTADLQGVVISNNVIRGAGAVTAGQAAIDLQALDTFTVSGNTLQLQVGSGVQYGIRVRNTCTNGLLVGNNIQGATVAAHQVDAGATCNVSLQPF